MLEPAAVVSPDMVSSVEEVLQPDMARDAKAPARRIFWRFVTPNTVVLDRCVGWAAGGRWPPAWCCCPLCDW